MGQLTHALDKELHGKHWDIPPSSETSVLQGVLDDLDAAAPRKDEGTVDTASSGILDAETDNDLHLNLIISARKVLLSDRYLALVDYPLNAIGPVLLPKITKQKLLAKSLPEVALWHRQGVQPFLLDSSWIQVTDTYFKSDPSPISNGIRPRQWGEKPLYFINQFLAHLEDIDFGSKMHLMWLYYTPTDAFHSITINKFRSGYLVQGSLWPKRWDAVDEAVEKLTAHPSS
ncbi:hypothetical protein DXG01_013920 [Tephrocybe rancida]|nr:hypothetical protein DXG01_013920 [Tephrocybe rancida]